MTATMPREGEKIRAADTDTKRETLRKSKGKNDLRREVSGLTRLLENNHGEPHK